ncbi:MAG: 50S ribosomal protein L31e [Methanomicrobiales archaeon]|nr:50S ribosomal protein L31e [Methanomicrobiales archaeon]
MVEKLQEQMYVIPLGAVKRAPRWRRSAKAMKDIRAFLSKHMKSEDVRLGQDINEHVWARGTEKPPSKIRVRAMKLEDGQVQAELAEE